jgi:hypothetical protein
LALAPRPPAPPLSGALYSEGVQSTCAPLAIISLKTSTSEATAARKNGDPLFVTSQHSDVECS